MTSLDTAIKAVRRVMLALPEKAMPYVMSDDCPVDDLMHALTTMQAVERERVAEGIQIFNEDGSRFQIPVQKDDWA